MAKLRGNFTRVMKYHLRQKGGSVFLGFLFLVGALAGTKLYVLCDEESVELLAALFGLQQDSSLMELFYNRFFTEAVQMFL